MKMKKLFITSLILMTGSSLALAGTYNFYFYDNDKDKNPQMQGPQEQQKENDNLSQDQVSRIADEVAKKLKNGNEGLSTSSDADSFISKDTYFSVGIGSENYYHPEPTKIRANPSNRDAATVFARIKFLPLLGFEASACTTEYSIKNFYRAGGFAEFKLSRNIATHLTGGVFGDDTVRSTGPKPEGKKINPYAGIGLKLRIFDHFDLSASINAKIASVKTYGANFLDWQYGRPFYTAGVSYVF